MNTAVENGICSSCGVEARNGALFCYNCGGAVTKKITPEEEESTSDVWFRGEIVENNKVTEEEKTISENGKTEAVSEKETPETEEMETPETGEIETPEIEEKETPETGEKETPDQKVERKTEPEVEEKKIFKPKGKIKRNSTLRSASALRNKPKINGIKKVEVVWEERENSPNVLFLLVAFLLVSAAAGIFFLAMYLK